MCLLSVVLGALPVSHVWSEILVAADRFSVVEYSGSLLNRQVREKRQKAGLVGLGAMVMVDGKIIASAVDGERKNGSGVILRIEDQWHIGSVTKSFTATLTARLVENGSLNWDTTLKTIFEGGAIDSGWYPVTLKQLLTHTSGVSSNFSSVGTDGKSAAVEERMAMRRAAVLELLEGPPQFSPGSRFHYSNTGFAIAAVIVEITTKTPWETLIEDQIFSPLNLKSAGFGVPMDARNSLEQPRGHRTSWGITKSNREDNSPIIGPAGSIHMSMEDLLTYANEHLQGREGKGILLEKQTYETLHTPSLNSYAFGWVVTEGQNWANGPVVWHNGSNTSWYTMLAIFPGLNSVMVVNSNHGRIKRAEKAAWEILKQMALDVQNKQTTNEKVNAERSHPGATNMLSR